MSEKIKSEMISRRGTFSLVWKAAAVSLAVPAVVVLATLRKPKHKPKASNAVIRDKVAGRIGAISVVIKVSTSGVVERTDAPLASRRMPEISKMPSLAQTGVDQKPTFVKSVSAPLGRNPHAGKEIQS